MKNIVIGISIMAFVTFGIYAIFRSDSSNREPDIGVRDDVSDISRYESSEFKIAFSYPREYFLVERELGNGERYHRQIALYEDTQENRDVIAGKSPGREGPISITFDIYQNNIDQLAVEAWIKGTNNSNFKLSDGTLLPITVSGLPALAYQHTGLYENDAIAFAHNGNIILAVVSYNMPNDDIREVFAEVITSVILR